MLDIDKIDRCKDLLPEPGNEVVGELITEIRRLRDEAKEQTSSAPSEFNGSATRCNELALPLAKTILEKLKKNKTTLLWLEGSIEVLISTLNGELVE